MNLKLNPSGPGDLSDAQEETASLISSSEKGVIRLSASAWDRELKARPSIIGLLGYFSEKISLKYDEAALRISWGWSITTPSCEIASMEFFLFLIEAVTWKKRVFLSPSDSHWALDFWAHRDSFFFYQSHRSSWALFRARISDDERLLWFAFSSNAWMTASQAEIFDSIEPNSHWFHFLREVFTSLSFSGKERLGEEYQVSLIILRHEGWDSQQFIKRKGFGPQFISEEIAIRGQWSDKDRFRREDLRFGKTWSHSGFMRILSILLLEFPLCQTIRGGNI